MAPKTRVITELVYCTDDKTESLLLYQYDVDKSISAAIEYLSVFYPELKRDGIAKFFARSLEYRIYRDEYVIRLKMEPMD